MENEIKDKLREIADRSVALMATVYRDETYIKRFNGRRKYALNNLLSNVYTKTSRYLNEKRISK